MSRPPDTQRTVPPATTFLGFLAFAGVGVSLAQLIQDQAQAAAPLVVTIAGIFAGFGAGRRSKTAHATKKRAEVLLLAASLFGFLLAQTLVLHASTTPYGLILSLLIWFPFGFGWGRWGHIGARKLPRPLSWVIGTLSLALFLVAPIYGCLTVLLLPASLLFPSDAPLPYRTRGRSIVAVLIGAATSAAAVSSWPLITLIQGTPPNGMARFAAVLCAGILVARNIRHWDNGTAFLLGTAGLGLTGVTLGALPLAGSILSADGIAAPLLGLGPAAVELLFLSGFALPLGLAAGAADREDGSFQAGVAAGLLAALVGASLPPDTFLRTAASVFSLLVAVEMVASPGLLRRSAAFVAVCVAGSALLLPPPGLKAPHAEFLGLWTELRSTQAPLIPVAAFRDLDGIALLFRDAGGDTIHVAGRTASTTATATSGGAFAGLLAASLHPQPITASLVGFDLPAANVLRHAGPSSLRVAEHDRSLLSAFRDARGLTPALLSDPTLQILEAGDSPPPFSSDLALSSPPPPWQPGSGRIYSKRHFRELKNLLRNGGVAAFLLPLGGLAQTDLAATLHAWSEIFPDGTAWLGTGTELELVLIGGHGNQVPAEHIFRTFEDTRTFELRENAGLFSPADLLRRCLGSTRNLAELIGVSRGGLLTFAQGLPERAWRQRRERLRPNVLGKVAAHLPTLSSLVDPGGLDTAAAAQLQAMLIQEDAARETSLRLMDMVWRGQGGDMDRVQAELTGQPGNAVSSVLGVGAYVERGLQALIAGDPLRAQAECLTGLSLSPEDRRVNTCLARIFVAKGQCTEAARYLDQAEEGLSRPDVVLRVLRAECQFAEGRVSEAITGLEDALLYSPGNAEANFSLGRGHYLAGNFPEASIRLQRAAALEPSRNDVRLLLGGALSMQADMRSTPPDEATRLRDEAVRQLQRVLAQDPDNLEARADLAVVLLRSGRVDEAAVRCQEIVLVDPQNLVCLNTLGIAFAHRGQLLKAREQFERVLEVNPEDPTARENLRRYRQAVPTDPPAE